MRQILSLYLYYHAIRKYKIIKSSSYSLILTSEISNNKVNLTRLTTVYHPCNISYYNMDYLREGAAKIPFDIIRTMDYGKTNNTKAK